MNKSLKFLAIGLALAVLLVSQVGVDRSAVAHEVDNHEIEDLVELGQDKVAFTDSHGQEKGYYRNDGDMVHFVLRDNDLAQDTSKFEGTVTWVLGSLEAIPEKSRFDLVNGTIYKGGDDDPSMTVVPRLTATTTAGTVTATLNIDNPQSEGDTGETSTVTFSGTDMPFGTNAYAGGFNATTTDPLDPANNPARLVRSVGDANLTPLVGDPKVEIGTMTVAADGGTSRRFTSDELILRRNLDDGTFTLLEGVEAPESEEALIAGETIFTVVRATFNYHIVDVFTADQRDGTSADTDENRALVTTSSFPSGKWVTISEIKALDDASDHLADVSNAAPRSGYYYGSITVVNDAAEGRKDANIWARDGDTVTVEFFESDHTTAIGDAEATVDALKPSISAVDPASGVLKETPVITFDVSDGGSGFATGDFEGHVDLYLMHEGDEGSECLVKDQELSATSLSSEEVSVQFRSRKDWGDGEAIGCDLSGTGTALTFEARTTRPGDNNHGDVFVIKVVARDVAGNVQMKTAEVTIDTVIPDLREGQTGKTWDVDEGVQADARNSIKLVFNESLDKATVEPEDFEVENPDVTVDAVIVGGVNDEDGRNEDEFVYLTLSEDLGSSDEPKVDIVGSIADRAGNERKKGTITRLTDRIGPDVTVAPISVLLAEKGEASVAFSADENMSQGSIEQPETCTCLSISGGGAATAGTDTNVMGVTLPTPKTATYTFEQSVFKATGIYGVLVQATDSSANEDQVGEKKTTEMVTADVADGATPTEIDVGGATSTMYMAIVKLGKWPLADFPFDGSLADSVTIKDAQSTVVTNVNWRDGKVTLKITYKGTMPASSDDYPVMDKKDLEATYHYVDAEQVIEVDIDDPEVKEVIASGQNEDGATENARPFITIEFDEEEYAGDTHKTVVVTSATLTDEDDNETVLVDADNDVNLLSTSNNIKFSYLPAENLDLGEYTISVIAEDDAGNVMDKASEHKFKVVARPAVTIPLNLGWNLISLPGAAADSSIDAVINVEQVTQVLTYDPTVEGGWLAAVRVNGGWEGGLTNIDATKAYLVYTTSVDDLKVDIPGLAQGDDVLPPTTELYEGWNMVASSSLNPGKDFPRDIDDYLTVDWSRGYYYGDDGRLVGFTPVEQDDEELVKTGRGFLIYVTKGGTQVP